MLMDGSLQPSDMNELKRIIEEHVRDRYDYSKALEIINKVKREMGK